MNLFRFGFTLVKKTLMPSSNLGIQGEMVKKSIDFYLAKLNRLLVWPTLVLFIIYVLSGYGVTNPKLVSELTRGVLTHALSLYLHTTLTLPVLILLSIHILAGIRSSLVRLGVEDSKLLSVFIILMGVFSITLLMLMQFLRF